MWIIYACFTPKYIPGPPPETKPGGPLAMVTWQEVQRSRRRRWRSPRIVNRIVAKIVAKIVWSGQSKRRSREHSGLCSTIPAVNRWTTSGGRRSSGASRHSPALLHRNRLRWGGYLLLTVSVWSMLTSTYQYMCTWLNSMGRGSSFKHLLFLVKGDS